MSSFISRTLLEELIKSLFDRVTKEEMQVVRIRRQNLWKDALRAFAKASFLTNTLLNVQFIGEQGVDAGGPRREFLNIMMKKLVLESGLLTGDEKRKSFTANPLLILNEAYFAAGKMVATSVIQGGPGVKCLSPAVYYYIIGDKNASRNEIGVLDIPNREIQEKLKKASCHCHILNLLIFR